MFSWSMTAGFEGQSDGQSEPVPEAGNRVDTGEETTQDHLRNRRSQVRILSGALKIWLTDCVRGWLA